MSKGQRNICVFIFEKTQEQYFSLDSIYEYLDYSKQSFLGRLAIKSRVKSTLSSLEKYGYIKFSNKRKVYLKKIDFNTNFKKPLNKKNDNKITVITPGNENVNKKERKFSLIEKNKLVEAEIYEKELNSLKTNDKIKNSNITKKDLNIKEENDQGQDKEENTNNNIKYTNPKEEIIHDQLLIKHKKNHKKKEIVHQLNNFSVSYLYKNYPDFVSFLTLNKVFNINEMSPFIIFEYFEFNKLQDLYKIIDIYIDSRLDYNALYYSNEDDDNFPNIKFEDYYIILYMLQRNDYNNIINFNLESIRKKIDKYGFNLNLDNIQKLYYIKNNMFKIFEVNERDFLRNRYILEDYFKLHKEYKIEEYTQEVATLENDQKCEDPYKNDIKKTKRHLINLISIKSSESNQVDLYETFISGEIFFGKFYKKIMLDPYYTSMIFSSLTECSDLKKDVLLSLSRHYKKFYILNRLVIDRFHDGLIDNLMFIKKTRDNKPFYYTTVTKRISYKKLYDFFMKTVIYFDYKKENFTLSFLKDTIITNLFPFFEQTISNQNLEIKLQPYWEIYLQINSEIIKSNIDNNIKINLLSTNLNKFTSKANFNLELSTLFSNIMDIKFNTDRFIIGAINNKKLSEKFIENSIFTLQNLKDIDFSTFKTIFNKVDELAVLKSIYEDFSNNLEQRLFNKLGYFLNNSLIEREYFVIEKRSEGLTLEEIGNELNVTRERIRQIEGKALRKYKKSYANRTLELLKSYEINGQYVTRETLSSIYKEYLSIFLYLNKEKYNEEIELIELQDLSQVNRFINEQLKHTSKPYFHKDDLKDLSQQIREKGAFKTSEDYIELYILKSYHVIGEYIFLKRPNLVDLYEVILRNHFHDYDGLSLSNMAEFKDKYFEIFNDNSIYTRSDRAVLARAVDNENIVLTDRGVYTVKSEEKIISKDKLDQIYSYILKKENILIEALYLKFKHLIHPEVENKYQLHGLLKFHYNNLFFSKDVVGIKPNPSINIENIINEYIDEKDGIINLDQLIVDLPELAGIHYEFQISKQKDLVSMFNKNYTHKKYLIYDDDEMHKTKRLVEKRLENEYSLKSHQLYEIMVITAKKSIKSNKIENTHYCFNYFKSYFEDDFTYYGNSLTLIKREPVEITQYDEILKYFSSKKIFKISSIKRKFDEEQLRLNNIKRFLEEIYELDFLRIDDDVIAKKDFIINNQANKNIKEIEKLLLFSLKSQKSINLENINYSLLPKIGIKWNKHLIAHLLMELSNEIEVKTIGSQYNLLEYVLTLKGEKEND